MNRRDQVDQLFQEHAGELFRYLRSFRLPEDETYDMVQAVFLKLVETEPKKLRQPKAWLFAVGRNMAINAIRRAKRTQDSGPELPEPASDGPGALAALLKDEQYATLWRAFSHLPDGDQEMMRLSVEHGLTYEQIADVIGRSKGAVKVAMHRNRKKLRELYDRQEETELVHAEMRSMP